MKTKTKRNLISGIVLILAFIFWTVLVKTVDVESIGVNSTEIGFATVNGLVHSLTGVNMWLYTVTDWLGLVPVFVCLLFGFMGFIQFVKRKSLLKVDADIIILGIYYVIVILCYLVFEMIPVNYRPVLIDGFLEASYPSSTTLLVLSVMPTLNFQAERRIKNNRIKNIINIVSFLFSVFMVTGRLISGVHWFTDIVGSILLSSGLFLIYKGVTGRYVYGIQRKT